jgi:hypothetical protein
MRREVREWILTGIAMWVCTVLGLVLWAAGG